MTEAAEVFNELFFGAGKWLGLLLIISFILVLCWRKKEAAFVFVPINILWGLEYLETVSPEEPFFYGAIVFMALPIFIMVDYLRGNR